MIADRTACVCLDDASPPPTLLEKPPGQGRLSLRWNFSWMFAANVVYAGCQWAILSVLARLGTPTMVGQFVLAEAVAQVPGGGLGAVVHAHVQRAVCREGKTPLLIVELGRAEPQVCQDHVDALDARFRQDLR